MKEITNAQKNYLNIMNALWDFFTSKTGAFIIGVGAIVIGMYQFYISKPILKYEAEHTNIVSSTDVTDLKVTVREKEYKDMYLTTLTLMNTGSQALDGDDVSKVGHDPHTYCRAEKMPAWFRTTSTKSRRRRPSPPRLSLTTATFLSGSTTLIPTIR